VQQQVELQGEEAAFSHEVMERARSAITASFLKE
jgi:hypothetical protein